MFDRRSFLAGLSLPVVSILAFRLDPDPPRGSGNLSFAGAQEDPADAVQKLIEEARKKGERTVIVPDLLLPYSARRVQFDPEILLLRQGQRGGVVDAGAYGAAGVGEPGSDDEALAAAIDAAAHHGLTLHLPAGHRYLTTLTVRTSVTTSPDRPALFRLPPGSEGPVLSVEASGVTVRHLEVDGAAGEAGSVSAGIRLAGVNDCRVVQCHVHDTLGPGISVRGARNVVEHNRLERCHRRRGSIETEAFTVNCVIGDNVVRDAGHHAIRVANTGTRGTVVKGNRIVGTGGAGILQEVRASDTVISGNTILRTGGNGIKAEDGETAVISDNTVREAGANGIFVHTNPGSTVTGNVISSSAHRGIVTATRADGTAVTGNAVTQTSQEGIYLADSADCTVTGNTVRRAGSHGIHIAGDAVGYAVTGNAVRNATGEAVRDAARGASSRIDLNSGS